MRLIYLFFTLFTITSISQNLNVNEDFSYKLIRASILSGEINPKYSFNIKPIELSEFEEILNHKNKILFKNKNESIILKIMGVDYFIEYNSNHPYNRNNGTMIPNRGYQHIISPGFFFKAGPLSIQFKPEHHFSENKDFEGFWEGHEPEIWLKRYRLWNHIDMPERFGSNHHNKTTLGQSKISLNWGKLSLGLSNQNIWWGPSIKNSIMMSNNAQGFKHISFNTIKPIETLIGNFEWQIISARLESSGFKPPRYDYEYAGSTLYRPKINQNGRQDDWRYLQAFIFSYSPKWIDGLSIGLIRWVQMYSALVEGKYWWMNGNPTYFPAFSNLFRKNDKYVEYEAQTNQAAGIFMKWIWKDSNAEIYAEFHHNDSKQNFRDLILDSDHSRAATIGIQKIFKTDLNMFLFSWEWTQMEQTGSRLIRNAGSWYEHAWVYDGYTNRGEVLGSAIGPGSNSHFFGLSKIKNSEKIGIGLEIVDNDNDFFHEAFASAKDFRRYWKDLNFHLMYYKQFKNFNLSTNVVYIRSLNYQWELLENAQPYYQPGRDINNFHISLKLSYFITLDN